MLKFLNDTELAIFLWRHCADVFEGKTMVLMKHELTVERVEQIANHDKNWRICEGSIAKLFESLPKEKITKIREALKDTSIVVCSERENGWIDEMFSVNIKVETNDWNENKESFSQFADFVDMIACILSAVIDQQDIWAVTRLWSKLQPEVLPPLRRRVSEGRLNMVQSFFSYVMEANIQQNCGSDPVLAEHFDVLKLFENTVDHIHEDLISAQDMKKALFSAVRTACDFLLTKYPCSLKVKQAQKLVQNQISDLITNFDEMNKIFPNKEQKTPSFITFRERLCRSLVDRIVVMDVVIQMSDGMTPVFRTPSVKLLQTEDTNLDSDKEAVTPKASTAENKRLASFVNNGTPTPIRPERTALFPADDSLVVAGTLVELLEEDKENADLLARAQNITENSEQGVVVKQEQQTPKRKSCGQARIANKQKSDDASSKVVPPKKKNKNDPQQPSISAFFS